MNELVCATLHSACHSNAGVSVPGLEGKMFLEGYQLGMAEMILSEGRETSTYLSGHLISFLSLSLA